MACLVCSDVRRDVLVKRKGNRPSGVKDILLGLFEAAARTGSPTALATRRVLPERKTIPTRSHFGYFIPEALNTSCHTQAIDRVGPNANGHL